MKFPALDVEPFLNLLQRQGLIQSVQALRKFGAML
ncbi:hypothetical protein ABIA53_003231 [Pseudomonas monsensis]